jgi:hypothetical protein
MQHLPRELGSKPRPLVAGSGSFVEPRRFQRPRALCSFVSEVVAIGTLKTADHVAWDRPEFAEIATTTAGKLL